MGRYLGEEVVSDLNGTPYAGFTPQQWALEFIERYGQTGGSHHKQWVLDQVARILLGTPVVLSRATWDRGTVKQSEYRINTGEPSPAYRMWVVDQEGLIDDNGEPEYEYDRGLAP